MGKKMKEYQPRNIVVTIKSPKLKKGITTSLAIGFSLSLNDHSSSYCSLSLSLSHKTTTIYQTLQLISFMLLLAASEYFYYTSPLPPKVYMYPEKGYKTADSDDIFFLLLPCERNCRLDCKTNLYLFICV